MCRNAPATFSPSVSRPWLRSTRKSELPRSHESRFLVVSEGDSLVVVVPERAVPLLSREEPIALCEESPESARSYDRGGQFVVSSHAREQVVWFRLLVRMAWMEEVSVEEHGQP
jgi:hypothetical protein